MTDEAALMRRAAVAGDKKTVRAYLDASVPVNAPCNRGYTALHQAAWYGHVEVSRVLLKSGASVHQRNHATATPLCYAAERGHADVVRLLLQAGADPDERYGNGNTPLIVSIRHPPVLSLLLGAGADASVTNGVNATALVYAVIENSLPAAQILADHGATMYMPADPERMVLTFRARRGDELSRIIERVAPDLYAKLICDSNIWTKNDNEQLRGLVEKPPQPMPKTPRVNTTIRDRLLALVTEDRRVREELAATGELFVGYAPRMAEVHRNNADELEAILAQHGWPGTSLVGEEGANAAWLILQHAIGSPALQRDCLPLLQDAVTRGEAEPAHAAYLEDRIHFYERRPQRYGTQFDWDENGRMSPWHLQDPERVDEYRRDVGLEPLAQKIHEAREGTAGEAPPDFQTRQSEMNGWLRSTGWL